MLKKDLRKLYKNKRAELSNGQITEFSELICTKTLELLQGLSYQHLNCFLSSTSKKEVQTQGIINALWKQSKTVSVPVSNYHSKTITPVKFLSQDKLVLDEYEIPFPASQTVIDSKNIDIVICPLLCFDKNGFRTGYGKGMYDRFIQNCKNDVLLIGLSFFDSFEEIDDLNEFDQKLDYVITPQKTLKF